MMKLLLLVGLCGFVVGGPLQAGAQDRSGPSLPAFAETEASAFADGTWLGLAADFAPTSAFGLQAADASSATAPTAGGATDGEKPLTIETDYAVSNCDASGTLSVTYSVSAPEGLRKVDLFALVGGEVVEPSVDFKRRETSLTFTETFDLAPAKERWQFVSLTFGVVDIKRNEAATWLDLDIDFDSCTAREVMSVDVSDGEDPVVDLEDPDEPVEVGGDGNYPEITIDSAELTQCDATPKLTLSYTVSDSDGIVDIDNYWYTSTGLERNPVEFEPGATEVQFTLVLDLEIDDAAIAGVDVLDSADTRASSTAFVDIDIDSCTATVEDRSTEPGDDLPDDPDEYEDDGYWSGPSIEVDSIEITACDDTTPVVSIQYFISDEDGITEARAHILEAVGGPSIALPDASEGRKQLAGTLTVPINVFGQSGVNTWFSFEAVDSTGYGYWFDVPVEIDLDSCTVDF